MKELLDFHKKMYDVRWNGLKSDETEGKTMQELEDELIRLADQADVSLEEANEMLTQLHIPPYENEKLPEHLKAAIHGGKREGAGRPSLGTTKKVSLTLPDEIWDMIDKRKETWGASQSQTLRMLIEGYFYPENGEDDE